MHSLRTTLAAILALGAFAPVFAQDSEKVCYDNRGETSNMGVNTYQSNSACIKQCTAAKQAVWAVTKGSTCFCGNAVPTEGKVDMSECNVSCQGYPQEMCGGNLAWLFGYTGIVPEEDDPKSSKTTSKTTGASSTDIAVQTTVLSQDTATVTTTPGTGKESSGGGSSTAGIAAGAVVGVVAAIGLGVGIFLYIRRNRRRQAEEEYRAAVAAKEFTASIRKPQSDSRLDPVMLQHRLSDGSIADNQDFSRRILKVTNPDDA